MRARPTARSRGARRRGRARAARRRVASSTSASAAAAAPSRRASALAARVEDERRCRRSATPARRRRRRGPRSESTIRSQPLVRGERALQHRVLLVDQVRERLLGDRDERHLVGHLEEREAALGGRLDAAPSGTSACANPVPKPEAGEVVVGQPRRRTRAALGGVEQAIPVVSSSSPPDSHGVGSSQLGDVHPADRPVEARLAGERGGRRGRGSGRGAAAWRHCAAVQPLATPPRAPGAARRSISSNCSGPAISGGESWITGSPRSSARQISPRRNISAERKPRSSHSHSSSVNVSLVSGP